MMSWDFVYFDLLPVFPAVVKWINSFSPGKNVRHSADNIFKCIFMNEKTKVLYLDSDFTVQSLVLRVQLTITAALVLDNGWRRIGDKPLSEPMLTQFTDAYLDH